MPPDDGVPIEASGHELVISHPEKVFFDERADTKLDLVRYYQSVEASLVAAMGGRPVLMQRFPNGASGSSFFQKRVPESRPDWLETAIVSTPSGIMTDIEARDEGLGGEYLCRVW